MRPTPTGPMRTARAFTRAKPITSVITRALPRRAADFRIPWYVFRVCSTGVLEGRIIRFGWRLWIHVFFYWEYASPIAGLSRLAALQAVDQLGLPFCDAFAAVSGSLQMSLKLFPAQVVNESMSKPFHFFGPGADRRLIAKDECF
jgi:hypothetical protein